MIWYCREGEAARIGFNVCFSPWFRLRLVIPYGRKKRFEIYFRWPRGIKGCRTWWPQFLVQRWDESEEEW